MALGYPSKAFMHQAVRLIWYFLSSDVFSTKWRLIRACSQPSSLIPGGAQGELGKSQFRPKRKAKGS